MILRKLGLAAAAMLMAAAPGMASAAEFTFGLTGNTPDNGQRGNVRTFTATNGAETLQVKVSAWSAKKTGNSYSISEAYLGAYPQGLGASAKNDTSHTIDNQGTFDFLVFQFDQAVEVQKATFTPFSVGGSSDSDATIGVGNIDLSFASDVDFANWASVASVFGPFEENAGGSRTSTRDINLANEIGNLLFVGASFKDFAKFDGFKLSGLVVDTIDRVETPAVPEPASWAMMIAGFGLVGGTMRRRAVRFQLA
ncbi:MULTISPECIES: PEPxxWA-CTERM sorting domain-containing protein [Sphingomonadales]|uniref:Ice-binding protein C-terminal domain-containing protein n=1 Tax=Edaphosphingomonas haloaromaticamans TaxID=653954 RepID=A0A1S1HFH7_9SPHN|nr:MULTISPECIES: PEPxxWA-CTERM sorting domain-containing protein [Sphingomonas]AGH48501.1 conserved repeat protein [Sphingomonas sp. MM-1]MDX3883321.1 PEPxxWA-CTERM sorting domain-containing protein [Sphingomonas sp.]OHT20974.1 hypothetical protein BHE75_02979 [Sphingomonas haloaromaticamans]